MQNYRALNLLFLDRDSISSILKNTVGEMQNITLIKISPVTSRSLLSLQ